MIELSKLTSDIISHKGITFYNIPKQNMSKLLDAILELIRNSFLIVTAVDGSVDDYLEKYLQEGAIKFDFFNSKIIF